MGKKKEIDSNREKEIASNIQQIKDSFPLWSAKEIRKAAIDKYKNEHPKEISEGKGRLKVAKRLFGRRPDALQQPHWPGFVESD